MGEQGTPNMIYEVRRQARGAEPPVKQRPWRRRLVIGGAVLLSLVALTTAYFVRFSLLHVKTLQAQVRARLVPSSSGVDGRMQVLYVRPGQRVAKGQELARLDDPQLRAGLSAAEAEMAIKQSLHTQAEVTCRRTEAGVEDATLRARLELEAAGERVTIAQKSLDLRKTQVIEEIRRAEAQCEEARARLGVILKTPRSEEVEVARVRLAAAEALEALYELEVTQSEQLVGEGIDSEYILQVKRTQLLTQQNKVREAELELAQIEAGPTEEQREIARQALAGREAELALARTGQMEVARSESELGLRESELRQAEAGLARMEGLKAEIELAKEGVKAAAEELKKAQAHVEAYRAGMSITSSVDGTVVRTLLHEGEVCRRGVPAIVVADDSEGLWVEGTVREKDAHLVKSGQTARIEMVVGSGRYVDAKVENVALATSELEGAGANPSPSRSAATSPVSVWVKLRPLEQHDGWLHGMSASATIRVR